VPAQGAAEAMERINFETGPDQYRHWRLGVDGEIATLTMDVDQDAGLFGDYELKLNSYDLGVDIELYDAVQRLRFEYPAVKTVVLRSGKDRVFCAGANIRMLGQASHGHKVNFCKFTNETRNFIEDASEVSGQKYICAVTGSAAGGGYEIALATDHIMLADDSSSSVALPEVPLLAVLPGTGGITRVTDKRKVRRDRADIFCTLEEGIRGERAVQWRLVDEIAKHSEFDEAIAKRAKALAAQSDRPAEGKGVVFEKLDRETGDDFIRYSHVLVEIDRAACTATVTVRGPETDAPASAEAALDQGLEFWPLALSRELEHAIFELRFNEPEIGVVVFRSEGDGDKVNAYDALLGANGDHWFLREVAHFWKRTMKRVDVTSRSFVALVEPGSCFTGSLAELVFASDRSFMLIGQMEGDNRPEARICLNEMNFGPLPMGNGLSRLETRFLGEPETLEAARKLQGEALDAEAAEAAGLVTEAFDDIDWEDEVRIMVEERASFSPDSLTAMEANIRFAGPETMETKIFGRLTAWQNWIFQRPDAVGEHGALRRYGTGVKPEYKKERV